MVMVQEEVGDNYAAKNKTLIAIMILVIGLSSFGYVLYDPVKEQTGPLKSQLPMIIFKDKTALYQVITYENKAITALVIKLKPKFHQAFHKVYLNYRSQFVFNDGRPIIFRDEPIFWNREGNVVDYNYRVINEGNLFYVDTNAITQGTAMTLRELKTVAQARYHKSIRDNVRMEGLMRLKNESK
jgi:hypothetical protein